MVGFGECNLRNLRDTATFGDEILTMKSCFFQIIN